MRAGGGFLTAEWRYLAMLNYEVRADLLLPFVPAGTTIDFWNGKVFVSLVGFLFQKTSVFGLPYIPMHSDFEEVNLRFYVKQKTASEVRRGVVFIREIVPRWAIAFLARIFYNENYVARPMAHQIRSTEADGLSVNYHWRSKKIWNTMSLETEGKASLPEDGSEEQFITEHFWGYAAQRDGGCVEYRVTHPSWQVWRARIASFEGNPETLYGRDIGAVLRQKPVSAFLAQGSEVAVMRGRKLRTKLQTKL